MELHRAIRGLEALKKPAQVLLTTDSNNVMKGIRLSLGCRTGKKRGWKTAKASNRKERRLWNGA